MQLILHNHVSPVHVYTPLGLEPQTASFSSPASSLTFRSYAFLFVHEWRMCEVTNSYLNSWVDWSNVSKASHSSKQQ